MLSRLISKSSHLRLLTLICSQTQLSNPKPQPPHSPLLNPTFPFSLQPSRYFSNDGKQDDIWKLSSQNDETLFGELKAEDENVNMNGKSWSREKEGDDDDVFKGIAEEEVKDDDWATTEGYTPWNFAVEDNEDDVFGVGEGEGEGEGDGGSQSLMVGFGDGEDHKLKIEKTEQDNQLEAEEKALFVVLEGPNRAFGDLIAASGITEEMLDSLIALKDLEGVQGLPPLSEIEDMRYEKNTRKSSRAEIERQKQEEVAKSRVRQVDEKGRAYGTGRRKCSIARVWIQPGNGNFVINDKQFDVYFPMLDHRAALLRPFSETKTLGLWDVSCTVKGGGVTGQVGAVRLGISRALQCWEPDLRPPLREAGFLTRDSRVVERKKPGKAKARKSFQWVKR